MMIPMNVAAAENTYIHQYYSDEEKITAFVYGIASETPDVRIAGLSCDTENLGNLYNNADKYETVFLIDSSGSMSSFSDEIEAFLKECIDKKRDNEYYSIGLFASGNTPEYIVDCNNNQYALEKSLDKLKYDFQSTYIYDNLINTIDKLYTDNEAVYRRIVLITDGNENSAKGITVDDVIAEIDTNPVPVYTVTLQTNTKDNLESLKNIARLSRKSNAADIRISDGGDAIKPAAILTDEAKNTYCLSIIPPHDLLDGSLKAIEISDGTLSVKADIRMPMANLDSAESTEANEMDAELNETITESLPTENKGGDSKLPIIIVAAVIAVIGAIIGIIVGINKKKKNTPAQPTSLSDNEETMIIGDSRGGQTEMLFDDDFSIHNTVILRDVADSFRTFEVQLTSQGAILGRSSDYCNIVIDYDKSVSRKHCRIFLKNGKVYIEDLSSGNKTYVNGSEVTSDSPLNNADEIKIGRTKLKVTIK